MLDRLAFRVQPIDQIRKRKQRKKRNVGATREVCGICREGQEKEEKLD